MEDLTKTYKTKVERFDESHRLMLQQLRQGKEVTVQAGGCIFKVLDIKITENLFTKFTLR
jgi:hypothetical protein